MGIRRRRMGKDKYLGAKLLLGFAVILIVLVGGIFIAQTMGFNIKSLTGFINKGPVEEIPDTEGVIEVNVHPGQKLPGDTRLEDMSELENIWYEDIVDCHIKHFSVEGYTEASDSYENHEYRAGVCFYCGHVEGSDEAYIPQTKQETESENENLDSDNKETKEISSVTENGYLQVDFIDVGQGDSALIQWIDTNLEDGDDSASILVDAGDNTCGTTVRNYIKKQGVDELTYFVCTHPDADHIGGSASVVSNVPITSEIVWGPNFSKDTKTYEGLMNEIETKWYKYEEPEYGKIYNLGDATFMFVAPTKKHKDVNSNSLVFRLDYGEDSFLFVGDCEEEEELEIVNGSYANKIDCDVLKVGHHGSKTSSSEAFLNLVSPEIAVISCGEGNKYFHPHAAALNNLRALGCNLYRTDVQGSLQVTSHGDGLKWNASPCNDWTAGEGEN